MSLERASAGQFSVSDVAEQGQAEAAPYGVQRARGQSFELLELSVRSAKTRILR
jgi:hypothetical protein